jgi:exopolysaccharide biosynthesis polyprenyl glycosylphosphotransferase
MLPRPVLRNIWKTALLPVVDYISILLGSFFVYLVRYRWFNSSKFDSDNVLRGADYIATVLGVAFLIVLVFAFLGQYDLKTKKSIWKLLLNIILGIFSVLLPLIFFYLFNDNTRVNLLNGLIVSRFILATGGFFILYSVLVGRLVFWIIEQFLYYFNIGKMNVAVIGSENNQIVNYLENKNNINKVYNFHELNEHVFNEISLLIKKGYLSEVYIYSKHNEFEIKLAAIAERKKVSFLYVPFGFNQFSAFAKEPTIINQELFLQVKHTNLDGWFLVLKRLFDIIFAGSFLLVFSWLYLIIIIAIKLDSPGSIFYKNERVGPNGKVFSLYKFRRFKQEFCTTEKNEQALKIEQELIATQNMRDDKGPLYKIKNDPRMSRVGKFLEKTSLDELPQFINVLLGSLSVVGPRPHQPREVAKYESHHYKVLNIKPGITGFAQVNGRSDLTFEKEVYFDTYYVEHWSFPLDLWIIIQTPLVMFFKNHKA